MINPMSASPHPDAGGYTAEIVAGLADLDPAHWDALANPPGRESNPFISWAFLEALEASGCVGPGTGWTPRHVILRDADGRMVGAAPTYAKSHSQGEFVFDHGWANAYERAGGDYYPKLQTCVPFTPVTGPRLLVADPAHAPALLTALVQLSERAGVSSLHVTFAPEDEWRAAAEMGLLQRVDTQFHWRNAGYATFEEFLTVLASRKRKGLRKERATAQAGLTFARLSGDDLTSADWDAFFAFYMDTGARKWGAPYLNRAFFDLVHQRMRDEVVMVMAKDGATPIAGALNFVGSHALYGRYWGRREDRPCLHFEVCYYQAIDEAIARGLSRVEAGAQGGHKVARGYGPEPVYSYHWIAHAGLRDAVADFLEHERAAVRDDIDFIAARTPFRKGDTETAPDTRPDESSD